MDHKSAVGLAIVLLLAASSATSATRVFEATGEVKTTAFDDGAVSQTFTVNYKVSVDGCRVAIRATSPSQAKVDYYEYSSEGTNSSLLIRYRDTNIVTEAFRSRGGKLEVVKLATPVAANNQASLILRPDVVPEFGFDFISAVWLAFGSRCFYDSQQSGGMVAPIFSMGEGFRESGGRVKSQWVLADAPPGLLKSMADFSNGNEYLKTSSGLSVRKLPRPFNQGFTNSIFQVVNWTNVAGLSIPVAFHLLRFAPNSSARSEKDLKLLYSCEGTATTVRTELSVDTFEPHIPLRCRVTDSTISRRGASLSTFTYTTTNGKVLTYEELKQLKQFQFAAQNAFRTVRWAPLKRMLLLAAFVILLLLPLAAFFTRTKLPNQDRRR